MFLVLPDLVPHRYFLQGFGDFLVSVLVKGVDVGLDGASEESGVLRDDGDVVSKRMQA